MIIGLVYDLRDDYEKLGFSAEQIAEFDSTQTIYSIEKALLSLGHNVELVGNIWRLVEKLSAGSRWDLVFNIAEGLYGMAREAQVPALLDAYRIPYVFSAAEVLVISHNKSIAKNIVGKAGVPVASERIVSAINDAEYMDLPYPLFAKPLAEGTGKGVSNLSLISNKKQLLHTCGQLLEKFNQPVLVEKYLCGREFTVGIIGTGDAANAIGVLEIILNPQADSVGHTYNNKENCAKLVTYILVKDKTALQAKQVALTAWKALGCRDGGRIDIRCDSDGVPHFLEVNPLAGLHPTHSDLPILCSKAGVEYNELIRRILSSAIERNKLNDESTEAYKLKSALL
jgi:D-alanine-D-alanine ligase